MLYELLVTIFVILCVILIFLILLQKSKSSLGVSYGGATQMLFGGSGGQDLFQKTTWILGALFMAISFAIALMKNPTKSGLLTKIATQQPVKEPVKAVAANGNTQVGPEQKRTEEQALAQNSQTQEVKQSDKNATTETKQASPATQANQPAKANTQAAPQAPAQVAK